MNTIVKNRKNNVKEGKKKERIEIEFKDITEDFTKEIEERKRIIILVEHSKSYAKEYAFKTYVNKRFQYRGDKYIVAVAHLDFIPVEELKPSNLVDILKADLNKVYNEFKNRYPDSILEKPFSFNYAIDCSEKSKKCEIMTIALMRVSEEYSRVQFSPIVTLTKEKYNMLLGKDDSQEGRLLYDLITEKRMGIEQFGLIGYLTDGKFKTYNMYMECLLDLIPEYKNDEVFRPKALEYKNYRTSKNAYLFSIKTEKEKKEYIDNENESIV